MSFQEKSTALMLGIVVLVYAWYFATILGRIADAPVEQISYQPVMLVTVGALVVLAIVGHILIVLSPGYEGDRSDERDRLIDIRGEWIGGFVLGVGTLTGLLLAMAELETFWIANALLAGLVLSEIVSGVAKLVLYRRAI